ncbi:glycosyltransferase [Pseudobutyrivibrio ruminis]|uniref:Glycosyltransferase involved in cell wall bisynthesis n=1 Tax=Pseudobutyrivibrio ruminis DSM 9787 TaxID=1123011 RepID=A0A285S9C2_9FIRM|nr:glycosyltransferase [Pseudobutyrivibrio ruminis]SOC03971.1 Glycosyltransferase involved in cell wall bisynthesis [Pseudobutyrivibrio ruminis DSM 9787]
MMKIMQVIPVLDIGGAETMLCNLSCELQKMGHNVMVVTYYERESSLEYKLKKNGVKLYSLDKKVGFDIKTIRKLKNLINEEKPDIIHTHLHVLPYVWLASGKTKIIHTLHSIAQKEQSGIGKIICGWLYRNSHKCIPVAISFGVYESLKIEHRVKRDIPVVENGVPVENIISKESYVLNDYIEIYHVGRIVPLKNHEMMVEACEKLVEEYPTIRFHFFGEGPDSKKISKMIEDRRLEDNVLLEGTHSTLESELCRGDIFILPSEYEGMPMSLIEAMAAGLPCVATNVGGVPDLIDDGKNGILIRRNIDSLVDAIKMLIENLSFRETIGKAAKEKSVLFSSKTMAEKYIEVYLKSLGKEN